MPTLDMIVLDMYRQTNAAKRSLLATAAAASETAIRMAPVRRNAEAEIAQLEGEMRRALVQHLLSRRHAGALRSEHTNVEN